MSFEDIDQLEAGPISLDEAANQKSTEYLTPPPAAEDFVSKSLEHHTL